MSLSSFGYNSTESSDGENPDFRRCVRMSFACGSEEARQYKVFGITPRGNFVFYVFLSQPTYVLLRVGLEFVFAIFAAEVVRLPFVEVMRSEERRVGKGWRC